MAYWFFAGRVSDSYSDDVGNVLVSADGRTISATAPGQQIGTCADNTSSNLVADESASAVELRVHSRVERGFGVCAPGSAAMPGTLSVTLSSPLWGRSLVGGDGKPLPFFDGRTMLTPHPTPAGFRLFEIYPGAWLGSRVSGTAPAVVQDYNEGSTALYISQQVGNAWQTPNGAQMTETTVNGHPARLYTNRDAAIVEWAQNGQIVQVVYPSDASPDASASVLAIARSLR